MTFRQATKPNFPPSFNKVFLILILKCLSDSLIASETPFPNAELKQAENVLKFPKQTIHQSNPLNAATLWITECKTIKCLRGETVQKC